MRRQVIALLRKTGDRLQVAGAPRGRWRAFHEAAHFLGDLEGDLELLSADGRLTKRLPMAPEVRRVVEDLLAGREPTLPALPGERAEDLSSLAGVPPRWLCMIRERLGIRARKDLDDALRSGELEGLSWLPSAVVRRVERALLPPTETARWTLGEALPLARRLAGALRGMLDPRFFELTGSLRRGCEWVDGIHLLAAPPERNELHDAFADLPGLEDVTRVAPDVSRARAAEGLPVELRTVDAQGFGLALQFYTGSPGHTKHLRELAKASGLTFRQDRVARDGVRLPSETEAQVYEALGLPLVPPELRRGGAEVTDAREGRLPNLVKLPHLRGDCHVHSDFSDGTSTLADLAAGGAASGLRWMAVCDHSASLTFANGLSPERLARKREALDRINARGGACRLLLGAEVDILEDGRLDYPDEVLDGLDVVVAAVHLELVDGPRKMTKRILRALENPAVSILAHPTCRILGARPAKDVDAEAILVACRDRGVALEVNGHAHRMDPPLPFIERALELGVPLAFGSDAHHVDQLWMLELALLQARRAGAGPGQVLNTLEADQVLGRLRRRS